MKASSDGIIPIIALRAADGAGAERPRSDVGPAWPSESGAPERAQRDTTNSTLSLAHHRAVVTPPPRVICALPPESCAGRVTAAMPS